MKNSIPFPYQRQFYKDNEILERFEKLKKYDYTNNVICDKPYKLHSIKIPSQKLLFLSHHTIVVHPKTIFSIADMFQEDCRIRCKKHNCDMSPFDFWNKNQKKIKKKCIELYGKITPYNMRETLWNIPGNKECEPFKPQNLVMFIKLFKAKSVLDFSAGWGDRLVGAISQDVYYCGVDPNTCLFPNYNKIIDFFKANKKNINLINSPIQTANLPDQNFDLVMTSPPYFDLEKYTNENTQSISGFGNEKEWFDNFLKIAIKKCWKKINEGGHMVLNISQKNIKETYIAKMIKYIYDTFSDSHYLGVISYADKKISNPQPMFIWEKNSKRVPPKLYTPDYKITSHFYNKIDIPNLNIKKNTNNKKNKINFKVIDDGLGPIGGTKARAVVPFIEAHPEYGEFVYAGPQEGAAIVALCYSCELTRKKATIFVAKQIPRHHHVKYACSFRNSKLIESDDKRLKSVQKKAEEYVISENKKRNGKKVYLISFGLDIPEFTKMFCQNIKNAMPLELLKNNPKRIWVPGGSATLYKTLLKVFPNSHFVLIETGKSIWNDDKTLNMSRTKLIKKVEKFYNVAKYQPPKEYFNPVRTYDAKIWRFFLKCGEDGDYIYNVWKDFEFNVDCCDNEQNKKN
jgi:hypothetical protein